MKNEIKDLALNSEEFLDDMENLVKERVQNAVSRVIFIVIVLGVITLLIVW